MAGEDHVLDRWQLAATEWKRHLRVIPADHDGPGKVFLNLRHLTQPPADGVASESCEVQTDPLPAPKDLLRIANDPGAALFERMAIVLAEASRVLADDLQQAQQDATAVLDLESALRKLPRLPTLVIFKCAEAIGRQVAQAQRSIRSMRRERNLAREFSRQQERWLGTPPPRPILQVMQESAPGYADLVDAHRAEWAQAAIELADMLQLGIQSHAAKQRAIALRTVGNLNECVRVLCNQWVSSEVPGTLRQAIEAIDEHAHAIANTTNPDIERAERGLRQAAAILCPDPNRSKPHTTNLDQTVPRSVERHPSAPSPAPLDGATVAGEPQAGGASAGQQRGPAALSPSGVASTQGGSPTPPQEPDQPEFSPVERAITLLLRDGHLRQSTREYARRVGVSHSTLSRNSQWQRAWKATEPASSALPEGLKDADGNVEVWHDELCENCRQEPIARSVDVGGESMRLCEACAEKHAPRTK